MVYAVGLTGNIASGKTTAAKIFSEFGIEVINADDVSRELTAKNTPAYKKIIEHFGVSLLTNDDEINRRSLRTIIFTDATERKWLENLLHPLIRKEIAHRVSLCSTPYCIVEIPLLTDKQNYPYLSRVLVITAPVDMQIARLMARDNCSKETAEAILLTQPDLSLRLKIADDVINNNLDYEALKHSLEEVHLKYLKELDPVI
jgi:dephospho-CoA kinase